jgi:ATP-dependent DNA helicase RecG
MTDIQTISDLELLQESVDLECKLAEDLKVPFVLKGEVRQDETPVHHALREALINTLVHADYSDRASIKAVKSPLGFLFRNPGLMRVPPEQALQGGESDCRNGILHKLFLLVGLGERAGSGLPKIRHGWTGAIKLNDSLEPYNQTRLDLLWPSEITTGIRKGKSSLKTSGKTSGKIWAAMRKNARVSIPELSALTGVTERSVQRQLQQL